MKCAILALLCCASAFGQFSPFDPFTSRTAPDITAGLVGWWKLNESGGTTAADSSGGNNLTVSDGGVLSGGSLSLDGVNDCATNNAPVGLPTGNVTATACAWINMSAVQSAAVPGLIVFGTESDNRLWGIGIRDVGFYFLGYNNDISQAWSYSTGVRYHVACVTSSTTVKWYVNGAQVGSDGTLANTPNVGSDALVIGKQRPGNGVYFAGTVDDARIYNRALSAGELLYLYNRGPR